MKSDRRTLMVLLVAAILGPVWLQFPGPDASADEWVMRDMGACSPGYDSLQGVAIGDGDRDDRSEVYFCGEFGYIYQYIRSGNAWSVNNLGPIFNGSSGSAYSLAVCDGDDDGGPEIYVVGYDNGAPMLAWMKKNTIGWNRSRLCTLPGQSDKVVCGDGDNDGHREMYIACRDDHIYRYSFSGNGGLVDIGCATALMWSVAVGDGDNDGRNEVYGGSWDNHLYRFSWSGNAWSRTDMGTKDSSPLTNGMNAIAIADVDRDGKNEVYGLSQTNATPWRYDYDSASGSWRIANLGPLAPGGWALSMAIGEIDSSGKDKIYVGVYERINPGIRIYGISHDISNDTWNASVIGQIGSICYDLAIGSLAPEYEEVELFAALDEGIGYEYCHDRVPPANPAVSSDTHPEPGKWYRSVNAHVSWTDVRPDINGIAGYSFVWDHNASTIPDETIDGQATVRSYRKNLEDGDDWYFHIRTLDGSSNWNRTATHFGPVRIDKTPPDSAGVMIESDSTGINTSIVSLSVTARDPAPGSGVALMAFSNDGFFWSPWEPFAPVRAEWDLADSLYGATGTDGQMTVYFKVMDLAGNEILAKDRATDDIFVDRKGPVESGIVINDDANATNSTVVRLTLFGTDAEPSSGLADMAFSNDGIAWSDWEAWGPAKSWSLSDGAGGSTQDGKRTVWFRSRDGAGNVGKPVSDSIFLDTAAPSVLGFCINDGAPYTTGDRVSLQIDVADPEPSSKVGIMALSRDGIDWEDWEICTRVRSWDLGPDDGMQTVFLKVMDGAGNTGAAVNASIILDATAPKVSILPLPEVVSGPDFVVSWTGSDPTSGIRFYDIQYRTQNTSSDWTDWLSYMEITTAVFHGVDQNSYIFRARATDNAGNLGSFYDASSGWVKVDVPNPVVMINTPAARSTIKGVFEMNGSSYHPDANLTVVSVEIRVDDGPWSVVAGTSNWSWVLDTRLLPDGKHDVHVRAYDGSKYSPEVSREFTVKNAEKNTDAGGTPWSPFLRVMIALGVFGAVALLWFLSKRKAPKSR